jgi:hypothetical protein
VSQCSKYEEVARVHALDGVPEHRRVEPAGPERAPGDGEHARLPFAMEGGLIGLDLDGSEALRAPEVVDAVHTRIFASQPGACRADRGDPSRERAGMLAADADRA